MEFSMEEFAAVIIRPVQIAHNFFFPSIFRWLRRRLVFRSIVIVF